MQTDRLTFISFILGFSWLYNPRIDWATQSVAVWGSQCHQSCLGPQAMVGVPEDYWNLQEVFSKQRAQALPPHRPLGCAINLVPGAAPIRGRRFSLFPPEHTVEPWINISKRPLQVTSSQAVIGLLKTGFARHRVPCEVFSDNGAQFT
ncbi:uncharacterized protein lrfn4b [Tachysurus ichikawai]